MGEDLSCMEGLLALGNAGGVGLIVRVLVPIFAFCWLVWSLIRLWRVSGRHWGVGGAVVARRPVVVWAVWGGQKVNVDWGA